MHKKGDLELVQEALSSEIQLLQSVSSCVMNHALFGLIKTISDRTQALVFSQNQTGSFACHTRTGKIISFKHSLGVAHCYSF